MEYRVEYTLSNIAYWKSYILRVVNVYVVEYDFLDFLISDFRVGGGLPSPKKISLDLQKAEWVG